MLVTVASGFLIGYVIGVERAVGALVGPMIGVMVLSGASWVFGSWTFTGAVNGLTAFFVTLQMGYLLAAALHLGKPATLVQKGSVEADAIDSDRRPDPTSVSSLYPSPAFENKVRH